MCLCALLFSFYGLVLCQGEALGGGSVWLYICSLGWCVSSPLCMWAVGVIGSLRFLYTDIFPYFLLGSMEAYFEGVGGGWCPFILVDFRWIILLVL